MAAPSRDERLRAFLETEPAAVASNLKGPAALVSRATPQRMRLPVRTAATRVVGPLSARRLRALVQQTRAAGRPVSLHLGSGTEHKDGFINIDLLGADVDVALDLAAGIPLADDTVDNIFHEHVLEHLPTRVGYEFLKECRRVLRAGGTLRVAVPDAGQCIDSYAGKADPGWAESMPVPMMAVEDLFYEHKHVAMYDADKLTAVMRVAGFDNVEQREFGQSRMPNVPDTPRRREGTLYVEGTKPGSA